MYIMELMTHILPSRKRIALVVHGHRKQILMGWVERHQPLLEQRVLYTTSITDNLISRTTGVNVSAMLSGPVGSDQRAGAPTLGGKIDVLIFFWGLLNATPHDPDVKALLRLAAVWDIPAATNVVTADFIIQPLHFNNAVNIPIPDYQHYLVGRLK